MFWQKRSAETARVPQGIRIYAVGDIHGRYDLLRSLMHTIGEDSADRGSVQCRLVILGDFIDRGPDSRHVTEVLYRLRKSRNFICLKGNHENAMVESYRGNFVALRVWLEFGGRETLISWGLPPEIIQITNASAVMDAMAEHIPADYIEWMENLPLTHRAGDFFFVHAGVDPTISLRRQTADDLLSIRSPFLEHEGWMGAVIVHGHSITDQAIALNGNRIGIDTGAYRTGILSALAIEGDRQWILQTPAK